MLSGSTFSIVGLGNPGERYAQTRHNAGVWVVEALARSLTDSGVRWEEKLGCSYLRLSIDKIPIMLVLPQGFMNVSGQIFAPFFRFFKLDLENLIVVYDELDLPPGVLRLKHGGSSGGHRGVEDLIRNLGSQTFTRLRFGIGHPRDFLAEGASLTENAVSNWVLSKPRQEERQIFEDAVGRSVAALKALVTKGLVVAQREFHQLGKVTQR